MIGSPAHNNSINVVYKICIAVIALNIAVLPNQPVNLTVRICNIPVKAHGDK